MLYKKVHRQHLREFKVGRKFKYDDGGGSKVFEITSKPHIEGDYIWVDSWIFIDITSGQLLYIDDITRLD